MPLAVVKLPGVGFCTLGEGEGEGEGLAAVCFLLFLLCCFLCCCFFASAKPKEEEEAAGRVEIDTVSESACRLSESWMV